MISSIVQGWTDLTPAVNYLVDNAATDPTFWNNHAPMLAADRIITQDGTCNRQTKGRLTHIFQNAINYLSQKPIYQFDRQALRCRQGAASLMHGLGLTLDLDPLASSAFRMKLGLEEYEVPSEVIRRSSFFDAITRDDFIESTSGIIDLNESPLAQIPLETWQVYFSETLLKDLAGNNFYKKSLMLAELLQIASYFGDTAVVQGCISGFKAGVQTHQYQLPTVVDQLREQTIATLDILLDHDIDDLMKTIMMKHLVAPSPDTIELLRKMQAMGVDTHRIQHLSLQDHNELSNDFDYDAHMETLASLCPNLKYLTLTLPRNKGHVSRLPEAWKTSLVNFEFGHNVADRLTIEAFDNMPNLECLTFERRYSQVEGKWVSASPFSRAPTGSPKLNQSV